MADIPIQLRYSTTLGSVPSSADGTTAHLLIGEPAVTIAAAGTKVWVGEAASNRMLLSTVDSDTPVFAYLKLTGGTIHNPAGDTIVNLRAPAGQATTLGFPRDGSATNWDIGVGLVGNFRIRDTLGTPPIRLDITSTGLVEIARSLTVGGTPLVDQGQGTVNATAYYLNNTNLQAGFALTGPITTTATTPAANDLVNKSYVDQAVAAGGAFQSGWNPTTNTPNVIAATKANGYFWIAEAGQVPGGTNIPGIPDGTMFNDGDQIIWQAGTGTFLKIPAGGITQSDADNRYLRLIGGTLEAPGANTLLTLRADSATYESLLLFPRTGSTTNWDIGVGTAGNFRIRDSLGTPPIRLDINAAGQVHVAQNFIADGYATVGAGAAAPTAPTGGMLAGDFNAKRIFADGVAVGAVHVDDVTIGGTGTSIDPFRVIKISGGTY